MSCPRLVSTPLTTAPPSPPVLPTLASSSAHNFSSVIGSWVHVEEEMGEEVRVEEAKRVEEEVQVKEAKRVEEEEDLEAELLEGVEGVGELLDVQEAAVLRQVESHRLGGGGGGGELVYTCTNRVTG